jgi:quercetin dioxygenase-like cupin family protein
MRTVDLNTLPLQENYTTTNPAQRCRAAFPLFRALGTESTAMVYFELAPGDELGRHTDSAEEVILVLEGVVEGTIGAERGVLSQGQLAVVPRMLPHTFRNIGGQVARVVGFFPEARLVATFETEWQPAGSSIIDTDLIPVAA